MSPEVVLSHKGHNREAAKTNYTLHGTAQTVQCHNLSKNMVHCTALYCTVLYCTTLHCTALYCTALIAWKFFQCTALYCAKLVNLLLNSRHC